MKWGAKMKKTYRLPYTIILISTMTCVLFFFGTVWLKGYFNVQADKEDDMFRECIQNVFPVVSRGISVDREMKNDEIQDNENEAIYERIISHIFPLMNGTGTVTASASEELSEEKQNINQEEPEVISKEELSIGTSPDYQIITTENAKLPNRIGLDFSKPIVYIYHTHATESYRPVEEGNFHSVDEPGTVRQVGERMAKKLKEKGIKVIHDKTVHDYPSYNESYRRSLETIKNGLENNKSVKIVVDLHRDAADYKKENINTVMINGKKAAKYCIVVGTGNENANELKTFAEYILYKGNLLYPDLGDGIIEKPYKFNEYVSDYYILLEIGDNENNIDEALVTGEYFGEILFAVIEDIKK